MNRLFHKFHSLAEAKAILPPGCVPDFIWIPTEGGIPEDLFPGTGGPFILRSALRGEGSLDRMLSGKSLSCGGIESREDFKRACATALLQKDLDSVILQTEIKWDRHITLFTEGDFFSGEQLDRAHTLTHFFYNPLTRSQTEVDLEGIKDLLRDLRPILSQHSPWILELGVDGSRIHLFQIQPAQPGALQRIFSSSLVGEQVLSQSRFSKSKSIFSLIQTEWRAHRFRGRMESGSPSVSDVYSNWEFLFHYFRLHCMLNRTSASAEAFSHCLSEASESTTHLGALISKHLRIGSRLRPLESLPHLPAGFEGGLGPWFIGSAVIRGVLGEDILWQDEPDLTLIHSDRPPKAIVSSSASILSHPALACAEKGIGLVLGLPRDSRFTGTEKKMVEIDFSQKKISVS